LKKLFLMLLFSSLLLAKDEFLFYCGITMVKPMSKIAKIIEKKYNIKIVIIQGGSGDLYDSLVNSKKGDLYLPGSFSFIKKHENEHIFDYYKYVGYNQLAIFVKPNNPKNIKSLKDLTRDDLLVSLGNPETCSMGKESVRVLKKYGGESFLYKVEDNIVIFASDSRDFNQMLKDGKIDTGLNWKATAFFPNNKNKIEIITIPEKYAPKNDLYLAVLSFSKHKDIAKAFVDYVISPKGQKIMKEYGFIDD